MEAVEALIAADSGQHKKVAIAAHPALTRFVCVWAGDRRWTVSKRQYREALHPKSMSTAADDLSYGLTAWREDPYEDPAVFDGLNAGHPYSRRVQCHQTPATDQDKRRSGFMLGLL